MGRGGKRFDGRKLDHKTLEHIRIQAVRRVEEGESPEIIIRALGFSRPRIYEWIAKYRDGGLDALRAKPIPGRPSKLSGAQVRWIYRTIAHKNPLQLKFEFALWTCGMVRQLLRQRFGVRLSEVSVGRLLRKLGLSPQKPLRRAYQQDPVQVAQWLTEEYPKIQAQAKACGARIFFADEAGVRSDHHAGRTWAPVGKTPVVRTTGARYSVNLVSAVSPGGQLRFMVVPGRMTARKFRGFLERLMYNAKRPIFLIVDGHPTHRARAIKDFVLSTGGRLRLFFLPPYSPQLNPDELVWNHLKTHRIGRAAIRSLAHLKQMVRTSLRALQRSPRTVRAFFHEEHVRYALGR